MNIENLTKSLENKLLALDAKKKTSIEKGNVEIFNVFENEYIDTAVTLSLIKKASEEISYYKNEEIKNKLILNVLNNLPDLAFYFKTESINSVVKDTISEAFNKVAEEYFKGLVSISEFLVNK